MSAQPFGVCERCARHGMSAPRGLVQVECLPAFCEHASHGGPAREDRGPESDARAELLAAAFGAVLARRGRGVKQ